MSKPRLEDDFDNFVNFDWKQANEVPAEYPRFTNFTKIDMNLEKLKMEIAKNPENEFVNSIYNLFLNQDETSIKATMLKEITAIQAKETKQELITYLLKEIPKGNYLLFHIFLFF